MWAPFCEEITLNTGDYMKSSCRALRRKEFATYMIYMISKGYLMIN